MNEVGVDDRSRSYSAWGAAWLCFAPLGVWLLVTKTLKIAYTAAVWVGIGPDYARYGFIAPVFWVFGFGWTRFAGALLVALAARRFLAQRLLGARYRSSFTLGVFLLTLLALAILRARGGQDTVGQVLVGWCAKSAGELLVFVAGTWREPVTVAIFVVVIGTLLRFVSARARPLVVTGVQLVVVVLCFAVSLDLSYLLSTGQPSNAAVLLFSSSNLRDLLPFLKAELTPFRALLLIVGPLGAAWWARRLRWLSQSIVQRERLPRELIVAGVGALAFFLPLLPADSLPYERFDEGSIIAFAKTLVSSASLEASKKVRRDFEASGRPPWYSAGLKLTPTDKTVRKNVVIVMMESMRAVSTTMYSPKLDTTPFLQSLAQKGILVEDMNAIVPRTAGAWLAVLGGQYPLTNEGTKTWSDADVKRPRIRGLPSALREDGYGTAFFTPTHLGLLNEIQVVRSMGFETIVAEPELAAPGLEYANYMGFADEVMLPRILGWASEQARANRPFLAAVMTNVGHHSYETPRSWKPMKFNAPADPVLQAYLNCLRYVDGVLASLMKGFEHAGLLNNTIFVFVGDHGAYFGEHGITQVFNALYAEGVHVPAVLYAPSLLDKPGTIAGPRQQIDFLPTIAELLQYRVEGARLPGISLFAPVDPRRALFFSGSIESSYLAIRYGQTKFIYDFDRSPTVMFDLDADPGELLPQRSDQSESAKRDMLGWQAAARLSMFAHPPDGAASPDQKWVAE
ncbi:MAG TPA: LTA synthase family protein [Polyangiaceae bacterium]